MGVTNTSIGRTGVGGATWSCTRHRSHQRWAVFGRETRYVAGLYLRRAVVFSGIVLAIVLALDVARNMGRVLSPSGDTDNLNGLSALASYIALRAAFVVPSIFPIAAIMGVIWAEFGLARSRERMMVFSSGRAPVRSLISALLFGALVGLAQFTAISFSRPYSAEIQAMSKYRYFGPRYVGPSTDGDKWFVTDDAVFNARIAFGPPPVLRDVVVYRFSPSGRLESIVRAALASPTSQDGHWEFRTGTITTLGWKQGDDPGWSAASDVSFGKKDLAISLDPLWAEYVDVDPGLLTMVVLHDLATAGAGVPDSVVYKTAYQQRFAAILTCIAMALVGASLSLLMFSLHMNPTKLLQITLIGYGIHVGSTSLILLGAYGYVPVVLAIWILPLVLIASAFFVPYWFDRRVQNAIAAQAAVARAPA